MFNKSISLTVAALGLLALAGCNQRDDDAAEQAADAIEDSADAARDTADDTADAVRDSAE